MPWCDRSSQINFISTTTITPQMQLQASRSALSLFPPSFALPGPSQLRACRRSLSGPPSDPASKWKSRTHLKQPPTIPNPTPQIFPQIILLSDGSSFTSYTTAPVTAKIVRLTRDLTNNPLWNPAREGRKQGEEEGGRLSAFRRRFGAGTSQEEGSDKPAASAFGAEDLAWMSEEAGEQEKVSPKQMGGPQKGKAGKKK